MASRARNHAVENSPKRRKLSEDLESKEDVVPIAPPAGTTGPVTRRSHASLIPSAAAPTVKPTVTTTATSRPIKQEQKPDNQHPPKRKYKKRKAQNEGPNHEVLPSGLTEELLAAHPDLEWIVSHVMPQKVIWSSHPDLLKPHLLNFTSGLKSNEQDVVNTWFVESPVKSEDVQPQAASPTPLAAPTIDSLYQKAAQLIQNAHGLLIVAGAGIGVDSGLPDYRGPQGFWRDYPGLKNLGLSLEEMSHSDWFRSDPCAAWGFYGHRCQLYANAEPHQGFATLRSIARQKHEFFVFTSNIDSHFQKAGFEETKIYEAHGTLAVLQCVNEDCSHVWEPLNLTPVTLIAAMQGAVEVTEATEQPPGEHLITVADEKTLPKCPKCKEMGRPNVSMFGDDNVSWKPERAHAQRARMFQFLSKYVDLSSTGATDASKRLAIVEVGCGQSIHSLRCDVELLAQQFPNVDLIRVNPDLGEPQIFEQTRSDDPGVGVGAGGAKVLLPVGAKEGIVGIGALLGATSTRPRRFSSASRRGLL